MPRPRPPLLSVVLTALRSARGWTEQDLAHAAGISARMVSLYERDRQPARDKLEAFVAAMGYGPEAIDCLLLGLQRAIGPTAAPASPVDPSEDEERRIRKAAAQVGLVAVEATEARLFHLERTRSAQTARRQAAALWERLAPCTGAERSLLVENAREFQTWALAERLCAESEAATLDDSAQAVELAELAGRAAALAPATTPPADGRWRSRLTGYALAFLANAQRAHRDLAGADETLARASDLWQAGEGSDRGGVLAAWRIPYLEALLRRDQERFSDASACLDRAAALDPKAPSGRILAARASILDRAGETERANTLLRDAMPLVAESEPRLSFSLHFNFAATSCQLGRHAEAAMLLPRVRELAGKRPNPRDAARVRRLERTIAAGLGSPAPVVSEHPLYWCES